MNVIVLEPDLAVLHPIPLPSHFPRRRAADRYEADGAAQLRLQSSALEVVSCGRLPSRTHNFTSKTCQRSQHQDLGSMTPQSGDNDFDGQADVHQSLAIQLGQQRHLTVDMVACQLDNDASDLQTL